MLGTGSVTPVPSGGIPPYTYLWSNAQTTQTATGLAAGIYTVTVTDSVNCSISGTAQVTEPAALAVTAAVTQVSCTGSNNGQIDVTATGGSSPYTYLWNNGTTLEDRASLDKGTYKITVTDACGATFSKSIYVNQKTNPFALTLTKTNVRCAGTSSGIVTALASNGIPPYNYVWNTVPVSSTATVSGLASGTYTVIVGDASGCTRSGSVNVSHPAYITAVITQVNVSFPGGNNGSASLAVSGGVGPYTYSWNTIPVTTTASLTGLTAGVYKCTISDSKLCKKKVIVTITQPSAFMGQDKGDGSGSVHVTPNPSGGMIQLSMLEKKAGEGSIEILDVIGNVVYHKQCKLVRGLNSNQIDLRHLPRGIYFVRVQDKDRARIIKLVLQ